MQSLFLHAFVIMLVARRWLRGGIDLPLLLSLATLLWLCYGYIGYIAIIIGYISLS